MIAKKVTYKSLCDVDDFPFFCISDRQINFFLMNKVTYKR